MLSHRVVSRARLYEALRWFGLLRYALNDGDAKQDSVVVYGAEFGVVFLAKGPRTASIKECGRYVEVFFNLIEDSFRRQKKLK